MALQKGSKGGPVFTLQLLLNRQGASPRLREDGDFGNKTRDAVIWFQEVHSFATDGAVSIGGKVWNALTTIGAPLIPEYSKLVSELALSRDYETITCYNEGVDLEAHQVGGIWHIGKGHAATSGRAPIPTRGMKITVDQMNEIFKDDTQATEDALKKVLSSGPLPGVHLTQRQFDALGSLYFNRPRTFAKSYISEKQPGYRLLEAIQMGDWTLAELQWSQLKTAPDQKGKVWPGIAHRRQSEIDCAMGRKYVLGR